MIMKTLVVVDLQKDFYSPEGSLYVQGAEVLPERVAAIIPQYDAIIFTLDWHGPGHCSFTRNGGTWPVHCVRHSEGAALPQVVLDAIDNDRQQVGYFRKGAFDDKEEYGAFENLVGSEYSDWQAIAEADEIDVCGLCGDFCVGETIKNLVKSGFGEQISVLKDCTGSIDGGEVLEGIIKEYNLNVK